MYSSFNKTERPDVHSQIIDKIITTDLHSNQKDIPLESILKDFIALLDRKLQSIKEMYYGVLSKENQDSIVIKGMIQNYIDYYYEHPTALTEAEITNICLKTSDNAKKTIQENIRILQTVYQNTLVQPTILTHFEEIAVESFELVHREAVKNLRENLVALMNIINKTTDAENTKSE